MAYEFLFGDDSVKFGVISNNYNDICDAIRLRLLKFDVMQYFKTVDIDSKISVIPDWKDDKVFNLKKCKIGLTQINDNLCLYFCNMSDAWHSLFWGISDDLKGSSLFIQSSKDIKSNSNYIQSFEYFKNGTSSRICRVMFDEKWKYFQRGDKLDVENSFNYESHNIRNRLKRENIIDVFYFYIHDQGDLNPSRAHLWEYRE